MKNIPYRVWDVQREKHGRVTFLYTVSKNEVEVDYDDNVGEPIMVRPDTAVLEVNSFIRDVGGNYIYEGDIIKCLQHNFKWIVVFDTWACYGDSLTEWTDYMMKEYETIYMLSQKYRLKIIGNKHKAEDIENI